MPDTVKTRTLQKETHWVFRFRVVNPKRIAGIAAARRQGRVRDGRDPGHLFGYDATAGVVEDWTYEKVASSYVFIKTNAALMRKSNPGVRRGISERLLETIEGSQADLPGA